MLAGFSRLDITPPLGTPLAGTFSERLAEGIVDPIELNAVAFNDGESTAILIVTDALGILEDYATKIRKMIEAELGVPADHVMITATHTHSSFRLGRKPADATAVVRNPMDNEEYICVLLRKYVDAARVAIDDMKEAAVSFGEAETKEQTSFVRRYLMKDGRVQSFPKIEECPDIVRPMGEADNFLRLVRIDREDGKNIVLVNFSTHACIVTGKKFSPDWPGYLRKYVEAAIPNVYCIAYAGAEGDTNHINPNIQARQGGIEACERISRILADAAIEAYGRTKPVKTDKIASKVRFVYNRTRTDGMENYEEAKQGLEDHYSDKCKAHEQKLANWRRITNTGIMPVLQHVPVTTMAIGDLVIVGFGGEPFTQYATRAREMAPDKIVISAACANGYQGYLPTKSAFEDGGYESMSSFFSPTLEEEVMGSVSEMLKEIYE